MKKKNKDMDKYGLPKTSTYYDKLWEVPYPPGYKKDKEVGDVK